MTRRLSIACLIALLAAGSVAGQAQPSQPSPEAPQAPAPQAPPPTFRVQVDYVDVDVLVTDESGRFVRDLTRNDFEVFEDGRLQAISDFTVVDIPVERADRPLFAASPIEPDVRSNVRPFDGRVYVMILDDLHAEATRTQLFKNAARQFIDRNLGANDLMAIVHTGGRSDAAQEFTSNKRLLRAAVDKFIGRKLPSITLARTDEYYRQPGQPVGRVPDPYEMERGHNAQNTMRSLRQIAEWFGGVRGRRKTILFVSEGLDYNVDDIIRQYTQPSSPASGVLDDIRTTIATTARSNVSIYGIDPRGLTQLADDTIQVASFPDAGTGIGAVALGTELRNQQDNLRWLSEETGGFAAVNSNDFTSAFDRIVRDNSSYYVLAYYPPSTRRDGKFHKIEVKVKRPGLTVRARRGYVAPKGGNAGPRIAKNQGASPELLAALNSPIQVSGLTMRAFAAPFRGTPNASVLVGLELAGADLTLEANSRIEMSYLAVDAAGKIKEGKTNTLTLNFKPETRERAKDAGLQVLHRLDLPPGRYQLRVAARDTAGGAVGSLLYDLEVPDYSRQAFGMSGLVITTQVSSMTTMTVQPDEQLKAVLPAPPSARRTFPQNDELALFTEVYDDGKLPLHRVDIVTTVRSDEGRVLYKAEEERASSELEGKRGGYGYSARIPLSELAPGSYVLAVEARSRLGDQPQATRELQFIVTPPITPQQ